MNRIRDIAKQIANQARIVSVLNDARKISQGLRWEYRAGEISRIEMLRRILCLRILIVPDQSALAQSTLFVKTCNKARITYQGEIFVYSPDFYLLRMFSHANPSLLQMGNLPIDYTSLLAKGIAGIRREIEEARKYQGIRAENLQTLGTFEAACGGLETYANRCRQAVVNYAHSHPERKAITQRIIESLSSDLLSPAQGFHQALQTILLANALLWTTGMFHVGLGRLDQVLLPFYIKDMESEALNEESALFLLKEFLRQIHYGFYAKSAALPGDTGQVITISGCNLEGQDASTPLTLLFLQAVKELHLPDPKLVLRVHSCTPQSIWKTAEQCLLGGTGSPLLSNDNRVLPALNTFGFKPDESIQYATSACWEPCIPGLSVDQNNMLTLNFMAPLQRALNIANCSAGRFPDFSSFKSCYMENLKEEATSIAHRMASYKFQPNSFLSLLVEDCITNGRDVAMGGARYLNFGFTATALGNTVNALLNIMRLVFKERLIDFTALCSAARKNFQDNDILLATLLSGQDKFGSRSVNALQLSNEIIACVDAALRDLRSNNGGKFRFGVSSPAHISSAMDFPATLDGRKNNTSFGVHISPCISSRPIAPVESAHFAAHLDYSMAFNGGVFDMMVDKAQVDKHPGLLASFFRAGFSQGMFQAQVNILDVGVLKDAKVHPENYPDMIVRVWGFSAYFKDLPSEYQDVLIKRAEEAHAVSF